MASIPAELFVLSQDPWSIAVDKIRRAAVDRTMVGGKIVCELTHEFEGDDDSQGVAKMRSSSMNGTPSGVHRRTRTSGSEAT